MHPRRAIIEALRTALEGASSPALPVYEADETAQALPCWQVHVVAERRGDLSTRAEYERLLELRVTARAPTPTERDAMSEALEASLLGVSALGALEVVWESVDLTLPAESAGERTYPATYTCVAQLFSSR